MTMTDKVNTALAKLVRKADANRTRSDMPATLTSGMLLRWAFISPCLRAEHEERAQRPQAQQQIARSQSVGTLGCAAQRASLSLSP
jgi:hypothetical protein